MHSEVPVLAGVQSRPSDELISMSSEHLLGRDHHALPYDAPGHTSWRGHGAQQKG